MRPATETERMIRTLVHETRHTRENYRTRRTIRLEAQEILRRILPDSLSMSSIGLRHTSWLTRVEDPSIYGVLDEPFSLKHHVMSAKYPTTTWRCPTRSPPIGPL